MDFPTPTSSYLEKPRKRLFRKYRHFGTWRKLSEVLSEQFGIPINVKYPWEFAIKGIVPANRDIQHALGIPHHHLLTVKEVNDHLAHDPIQDMPIKLLAWAFKNREEIKP